MQYRLVFVLISWFFLGFPGFWCFVLIFCFFLQYVKSISGVRPVISKNDCFLVKSLHLLHKSRGMGAKKGSLHNVPILGSFIIIDIITINPIS
jgi:hypothetical protein